MLEKLLWSWSWRFGFGPGWTHARLVDRVIRTLATLADVAWPRFPRVRDFFTRRHQAVVGWGLQGIWK